MLEVAAGLSLTAAFLHAAAMPEHFAEWWGYGAFFLGITIAQAAYGVLLVRRPGRPLLLLGISGTAGIIGLYVIAISVGIPFVGPHAWHPERPSLLGLASKLAESGLLVLLVGLFRVYPAASDQPAGRPRSAAWPRLGLRSPLARLAVGVVLVLGLLAVGYRYGTGLDLGGQRGTVSASDAEACVRLSCDVHFTATLATQRYAEQLGVWPEVEPRLRTAQAFVLSATAHAGNIRQLSLAGKVFLRQGEVTYPSSGQTLQLSTHHDSYLVFFPRQDMQGRPLFGADSGPFVILIREAGDGWPQHTIAFNSALPATEATRPSLAQVVMVLGAAMAALLLTCTPCLVGSLAVGSMTTATAAGYNPQGGRKALVRTTITCLATLTAGYLAVAIAVFTLNLRIEDLRPVELLGGLVLIGTGLALLRATRLGARLEAALATAAVRQVPALRRYIGEETPQASLGTRTSSAMGASLAMVCSVSGAPTLTTATLLPLLVYAGLSSPAWAFAILLAYLLVCAVPFVLVASGWGESLMGLSLRWRGGLLAANATLLIALGLVLVFSPGAVAGAVSSPVRIALQPLGWLL